MGARTVLFEQHPRLPLMVSSSRVLECALARVSACLSISMSTSISISVFAMISIIASIRIIFIVLTLLLSVVALAGQGKLGSRFIVFHLTRGGLDRQHRELVGLLRDAREIP